MSIVPKKYFINNEIPLQFNTDSFKITSINSDNLSGLSLNISGQSNLNNLDVIGNLNSVNIVNSGSVTSNTISNIGGLTSNTITSTNLLTCNNGLTVSSGTVSFVAGSVAISAVNGVNGRLTACESNINKLQNFTSGIATVPTITANVLTINYSTNNNSPVLISPTANFSVVINNIPITNLNAVYRFELFITGKFYCNVLTVNTTVMSLTSVNGFSNIASQVNASATGLIQTFNILFVNNATVPNRANTEIKSTW